MKKILMALAAGSIIGSMSAMAADEGKPSWTDSITVKGDVRFRLEHIDDATRDETRERGRVRARVGVYGEVNDEVDAAIALASGSDDPVSSNQTLDEGFSTKDIRLDMAYIDLHPEAMPGNVVLGKMKPQWEMVSDLVFDSDLRPEGAHLVLDLGQDAVSFNLNGGAYWIDERSSADEAMLYIGQAVVGLDNDDVTVLFGGSIYSYSNIEGEEAIFDGDFFGNSSVTIGEDDDAVEVYATGYELAEGFVEVGFDAGLPAKVFANYIVNTDADEEDTGYLIGFKVGKAKNPGQVEFGYDYRDVEKDAVFATFSDSDSFGGGSDGRGHRIKGKVAISKNLSAGVTYFMNERSISSDATDYDRLQLDLVAKF